MAAIDYWCNLFTKEGLDSGWRNEPEIAEVIEWWGMHDRLIDRTPEEFEQYLDDAGMATVLIPSAKMFSYGDKRLIWDISEDTVSDLADAIPGRIRGLFGVNPFEGMAGVRRLESSVRERGFVGAHLHPYGFGLPINHRKLYPFYAKCAELDVPVVMQVGHSAERMPSEMGRPLLLDDIALDFPELKVVGAHTGWPWISEMVAMSWKHRNIYIGTSAHHPRYWDPELVRFANSRGKGKVLFGTDYPVMEHGDAIAAINGLDLREEARQLLLEGAAREVFKLT